MHPNANDTRTTNAVARAKVVKEIRDLLMERMRICCEYNSVGNDEAKGHIRAVLRKLEEIQ